MTVTDLPFFGFDLGLRGDDCYNPDSNEVLFVGNDDFHSTTLGNPLDVRPFNDLFLIDCTLYAISTCEVKAPQIEECLLTHRRNILYGEPYPSASLCGAAYAEYIHLSGIPRHGVVHHNCRNYFISPHWRTRTVDAPSWVFLSIAAIDVFAHSPEWPRVDIRRARRRSGLGSDTKKAILERPHRMPPSPHGVHLSYTMEAIAYYHEQISQRYYKWHDGWPEFQTDEYRRFRRRFLFYRQTMMQMYCQLARVFFRLRIVGLLGLRTLAISANESAKTEYEQALFR
jgi:hypothetical protein